MVGIYLLVLFNIILTLVVALNPPELSPKTAVALGEPATPLREEDLQSVVDDSEEDTAFYTYISDFNDFMTGDY